LALTILAVGESVICRSRSVTVTTGAVFSTVTTVTTPRYPLGSICPRIAFL
jgi:hypothetical protein